MRHRVGAPPSHRVPQALREDHSLQFSTPIQSVLMLQTPPQSPGCSGFHPLFPHSSFRESIHPSTQQSCYRAHSAPGTQWGGQKRL